MKTYALSTLLALGLAAGLLTSTGCLGIGTSAPATSPDQIAMKVLDTASRVGAGVAAAQAAEQSYFQSGQSRITAAEQAKIDSAFAAASETVLKAIGTYKAALTADNKQKLIDAIKNGITDIVSTLHVVSDQKLDAYVGWVNTAESLFLAVAS